MTLGTGQALGTTTGPDSTRSRKVLEEPVNDGRLADSRFTDDGQQGATLSSRDVEPTTQRMQFHVAADDELLLRPRLDVGWHAPHISWLHGAVKAVSDVQRSHEAFAIVAELLRRELRVSPTRQTGRARPPNEVRLLDDVAGVHEPRSVCGPRRNDRAITLQLCHRQTAGNGQRRAQGALEPWW